MTITTETQRHRGKNNYDTSRCIIQTVGNIKPLCALRAFVVNFEHFPQGKKINGGRQC